jgi:hypothetical protein
VVGRRGLELRPVDRQHRHLDQPRVGAEAEYLAEQIRQRPWWRALKRAIVAWSGTWFAQITRKATSSRQRRSIPLDERSPTA